MFLIVQTAGCSVRRAISDSGKMFYNYVIFIVGKFKTSVVVARTNWISFTFICLLYYSVSVFYSKLAFLYGVFQI